MHPDSSIILEDLYTSSGRIIILPIGGYLHVLTFLSGGAGNERRKRQKRKEGRLYHGRYFTYEQKYHSRLQAFKSSMGIGDTHCSGRGAKSIRGRETLFSIVVVSGGHLWWKINPLTPSGMASVLKIEKWRKVCIGSHKLTLYAIIFS